MKKSIFIILAFTIFCLTSCNNSRQEKVSYVDENENRGLTSCNNSSQEKEYFEKFEYHNSFCYNPNGNVINFDYVFFLPSKEINPTVAKVIKNSVFKDLYFENIDFTVDNYKDVINQYIKIFVDTTFKTDDIYLIAYDNYDYYFFNADSLYFLNEEIIGKNFYTEYYTGGDQIFSYYYTYFDANTGIVYDYNNVFSDKEKVSDMIFKKLNKMNEDENIEISLFLSDSNDIADIAPQFELKPDTIVFVFNPYEVFYAGGNVYVPFAFEEIKEYMNNNTPIYKYFNKK